jgi:Eukaryotic protein of unknown function (DUF846)
MPRHRVRRQVRRPTRRLRVTRKQVLYTLSLPVRISTTSSTYYHRCAQRPRRDISSGAMFQTGKSATAVSHSSHVNQSAHPVVLFVLYLFRIAAIATYILCGFFTDNYVISVCPISTHSQSITHFFPSLADRNSRRPSRHGLLELPRASFPSSDEPVCPTHPSRSERRWADSCWSTVLESGSHPSYPTLED